MPWGSNLEPSASEKNTIHSTTPHLTRALSTLGTLFKTDYFRWRFTTHLFSSQFLLVVYLLVGSGMPKTVDSVAN